MNIKQEGKKIKLYLNMKGFLAFVFGGGTEDRNKDLKLFTIGLTLWLWFAAAVVGSIVYLLNGTDMVYFEMVVHSLMIGSIMGFGITVVSILANGDFNSDYGWGLWWRTLIYNMIVFTLFYSIHIGATVKEHREPVKTFELITSDIKDCKFMVKMTSETLVYDHCSDYDHTYNQVAETKDLNVYLIGKIRYGTNIADHYEIVDKKIIRK